MGLTDSLRRLVAGTSETDEGPTYECTTCGREYEADRTMCVDCNSHVQKVSAG